MKFGISTEFHDDDNVVSKQTRTSHRSTRLFNTLFPLAPSPRVIELLARRARQASSPIMALVEVPQQVGYPPAVEKKAQEAPPPVVVTPADPWPRPYIFSDGLRRVAPYHFTYNTSCKERWRGRELLEIFADEFRDRPVEYYVSTSIYVCCAVTDKHRKMP